MAFGNKGKIGPKSVAKSFKPGRTVNNAAGDYGESRPQPPIPGPESTGGPVSMKRALKRKPFPGKGL
jgi:hypothetical protein